LTGDDRDVLWLAGVSWDGIPGADKQMVTCLKQHVRIFYVDPPISPATRSRSRNGSRRLFAPRLQVIDDRLTRLTPVVLPGLSRPGVRATTAPIVRRQVKAALARQGIKPPVVVSTSLEDMLGYWGPGVLNVLYGTDNYVGGAELMGLSVTRQQMQEKRALDKADKVICVTPPLASRWAGLGADPQVVLPGCVVTDMTGRSPAAGLPDLPKPVVGLIGQLSERLDLDAMQAVADAGFSMLIVGPVDPRWSDARFTELISRPNVHYTGPVPPSEVPSYLAAIDLGITPYRDTPFNRTAYPLKTMEYLGAGVPAVTSAMETARWLHDDLASTAGDAVADDILALAPDGVEFAAVVKRVADAVSSEVGADSGAGTPTPNLSSQAVEFASRHTWVPRAEEFAAAIGVG
jgi:teichuronic acid biosynthesis glycosyltransferase TuaH